MFAVHFAIPRLKTLLSRRSDSRSRNGEYGDQVDVHPAQYHGSVQHNDVDPGDDAPTGFDGRLTPRIERNFWKSPFPVFGIGIGRKFRAGKHRISDGGSAPIE